MGPDPFLMMGGVLFMSFHRTCTGLFGSHPEISDDTSIALRHALAHLKDDGIAVILVPTSVLVNYKSLCIREKLIKTCLDAVIELPAGASPNAGPMAALLVLKKDSKRKNIYMLDAKSFFKKVWKNT